jgi:hypothetical protein
MKPTIINLNIVLVILLISCGNSNEKKNSEKESIAANAAAPSNDNQQANGIVGEWEELFTCFDKNGNYKLEPEEKKASGTPLGFSWFKFNADGSCLRDKDVKFKGTYGIQEKNGNKKLVIQGGDNLHYTIHELTDKELILGSDGGFIVFKKIK